MPRVSRSSKLGFSYRLAVWMFRRPLLLFTIRDWSGAENLDVDGGVVVAPNHISWFDPLVVAHFCFDNDRPPRFLAKEAVFRVPVFGSIIAHAGQIPVKRDTVDAARSVEDGLEALSRGECVVIYPEGTITRDRDLWPMSGKTGAARMALMTGAPLLPMAQWGAQEVMRPYKFALRLLPRKTVTVILGPPLDLDDLRARPLDVDTLKLATDRLVDAMTELLARIRDVPAPTDRLDYQAYRAAQGDQPNSAQDGSFNP